MLLVAWQHVRHGPVRFVVLAAAVALPVLLALVVGGIYLGLLEGMVAFPRSLGGDLVVTQAGASPIFLRSTARIEPRVVQTLRAIPGVAAVDAIHGRLVWIERGGRRAMVFLIGIDPDATFAVPPRVLEGRGRPRKLDDVVLDRAAASELGLRLRQSFRIGGARLRLAGIADGGNSVIGTFGWVNRNALAFAAPLAPSHLFVRLAPAADRESVRRRIAALPELDVYTREAFVDETQSMARQFFGPVVGVIVAITSLVSALVVGLALWTACVERRTEHALLRALGFSRRRVCAVVLWEAALVAALGVTLGLGGSLAAARGIARGVPRFVVVMPWWFVAATAAAATLTALAASWLPARRVARTDPALVFRA